MNNELVKSAKLPQRKTLEGRLVALEPLDASVHGDSLFQAIPGPDAGALYQYMSYGPFAERTGFLADLCDKALSKDPLYYAAVEKAAGLAVGHAAYLRMAPEHCCIEVGSILYVPRFQRTAGATETMYLMAKYAFEELGYRRYEWKCDARNTASRRAAERLGFVFEGIFRQHMIVKGRNRDTAWFSMLDREWPARKAALENWLQPTNFDSSGRQRASLSAFS